MAGFKDHLIQAGWLTARQAGERLGITKSALAIWQRKGIVETRLCSDKTWLFKIPKDNPPRPRKGVSFTVRGLLPPVVNFLTKEVQYEP